MTVIDLPEDRPVRFVSDEHFDHQRIIAHTGRPFPDVVAMREELVRRANEGADERTLTIHLGDFAFRAATVRRLVPRLLGEHWIVLGNHDLVRRLDRLAREEAGHRAAGESGPYPAAEWVPSAEGAACYAEAGMRVVRNGALVRRHGRTLRLSHYPSRRRLHPLDRKALAFAPAPEGPPLVHGHTHAPDPGDAREVNVCVEARDYCPVAAEEVFAQASG